MAKSKSFIKGTFSGNVGTMNFRDRGDDMVAAARVFTNKSKGNGATDLQRAHRCKLANVVNFYKAKPALFARAFETKAKHQSDFNKFVQLNLAKASVLMPAAHAKAGCFVYDFFTLSEGSLGNLAASFSGGDTVVSAVKTSTDVDWDASTVGAISTALLAANTWLKAGDEINLVQVRNTSVLQLSKPERVCRLAVVSFVINTTDSRAFSSLKGDFNAEVSSDSSGVSFADGVPAAMIISRLNGANLLVSTSTIAFDPEGTNYENATSPEWKAAAMNSYGYKDHALLVPGE